MSIKSQQDLINKLHEMFPDTLTSNTVTREQILQVTTYVPSWLSSAKMARGIYALPGGKVVTPKVEETKVDDSPMVPARDEAYVPFGNFFHLETIIKSQKFFPAFVTGPTGNGKSTMVEQICAKHNRPMIRVNLNMMSDEEQLIGTKTLENGNVKVVYGPVLIAMKMGAVLLLDEIDAGTANALLCLQNILEGKSYYFKLNNEIIKPAQGFNIIATANSKGKGSEDGRYVGINVLNEAFLERFPVTFEQDYPGAKIETKIVTNLMTSYGCYNEKFAEDLVKWADAIRRTFNDGGIDDNMTTRRLAHIIKAYSIFNDTDYAVQLCCNRFDVTTKTAFLDLYEKICGGNDTPTEEKSEGPANF